MNIYLLSHSRKIEPDTTSSKILGIYSSLEVIDKTISKYKKIQGFKDYPDDFVVEEFEVISHLNNTIQPGQLVYLLQHEYSIDVYDYITDIDVFLNYDDAKAEMDELRRAHIYPSCTKGLYVDSDGYVIDKYIIDEDNWVEGFVTY